MGKLAHDSKAGGSADTVNGAFVLRQFMSLSGEVYLTRNAGCCGLVQLGTLGIQSPGTPSLLSAWCELSIFDPEFSESSYGFHPGRSAHATVRRVRAILNEGYTWVVDIDLAKFFDRLNHDVLMSRIARKLALSNAEGVKDKRVLRLIGRYLRAGVEVDGEVQPTTEGVPQGGPLSPLLANILLDDFDKELERRGLHFVRYADDFLIFVRSRRAAVGVGRSVVQFLKRWLKLEINRQKSRLVHAEQCDYLGFIFPDKRIVCAPESLENFKYVIRRLTARS